MHGAGQPSRGPFVRFAHVHQEQLLFLATLEWIHYVTTLGLVLLAAYLALYFGLFGLIFNFLGLCSFAALGLMKVLSGVDMTGNPLLILGAICVIVGMQMVMMGLLGEVTIRTYFESQNKPTYVIKKIREKDQ